ncbi:uncharacterized protein [Euwallacea similis]|uniref:uncharacterized protein n=1 Tax=Euwallacea similis TaxID=1736056 RepID=UPI003450811C
MILFKFTLILLLALLWPRLLLSQLPATIQQCFSFQNYKTYDRYFNISQNILITNILNGKEERQWTTLDLLDGFFAMNSKLLKKIVLLKNEFVYLSRSEYDKINTTENNTGEIIVYQNEGNVTEEDASGIFEQAKKHIDADVVRIFMGENPEVLMNYFSTTDISSVTRSARCFTILIFPTTAVNLLAINTLLTYLWTNFSILNVIAHFPCSVEYQDFIFTYKPFNHQNNKRQSCGQVVLYHCLYILEYPNLLLNHVKNLNGCPLMISLFERYPTAVARPPKFLQGSTIYKKIPSTSSFYGADGTAMSSLSEFLNFTLILSQDPNAQFYGKILENGTSKGSLKVILERTVDLQGNSRFMMPYGADGLEFTYMFHFDKVCVMVPKAEKLSKWMGTISMVTGKFAAFSLLVLLGCGVINKFFRAHPASLAQALQEIYASFLGQSVTYTIHPDNRLSRRAFLGSFYVYSIVLSTVFSGALLSEYTANKYLPDINTLEEFDKSGIGMRSSINPFKGIPIPLYERLAKKVVQKMKVVDDNLTSAEIAAANHLAGIERYLDGDLLIRTQFSDKNFNPLLHIVPECPNSFFLSYIVPLGSPYLKVINEFLVWVNEVGLKAKWFRDFAEGFIYDSRINKLHDETGTDGGRYKAFDFDDMKGILIIFLIGLTVALMIFFIEVCGSKLILVRRLKVSRGHWLKTLLLSK